MVKPPSSTRKSTRMSTQSEMARLKRLVAKKLKVRTPTKVSVYPSIFFKYAAHAKLWDSMIKRTLVGEPTLHAKDFEGLGIGELVGETNLLGTVSKLSLFVPHIVLEFYVNL